VLDADAATPVADVREAYVEYCKQNDYEPMTAQAFNRSLDLTLR
jgi:hypothetical protein